MDSEARRGAWDIARPLHTRAVSLVRVNRASTVVELEGWALVRGPLATPDRLDFKVHHANGRTYRVQITED